MMKELPEGWEWVEIGKVIKTILLTGKKIKKFDYQDVGKIPVVDQGRSIVGGYTDNEKLVITCDVPLIVFGDHTKAIKYVDFDFVAGADGTKVIKPNDTFHPKLFYYFLRSVRMPEKGYARHFQYLKRSCIPRPPLETQRRIVAILETAEETKRLRAQADELADQLIQSVFREMFGDPVTNPMGWEIEEIKNISERFSDGPFGSNLKTEHYTDKGVRVIRLQNIGIAKFLDGDKAYISEEHFSTLKKHTCISGDIIIGTMGNPNLRACILPKSIELAINKADCIQCRLDKRIALPEYICYLLNIPSTLIMAMNMIHGQTRNRISMGRLSTLRIPIPPLSFQQEFSKFVQRVETTKQRQAQSTQELDDLFNTLMQKAFTGELVA